MAQIIENEYYSLIPHILNKKRDEEILRMLDSEYFIQYLNSRNERIHKRYKQKTPKQKNPQFEKGDERINRLKKYLSKSLPEIYPDEDIFQKCEQFNEEQINTFRNRYNLGLTLTLPNESKHASIMKVKREEKPPFSQSRVTMYPPPIISEMAKHYPDKIKIPVLANPSNLRFSLRQSFFNTLFSRCMTKNYVWIDNPSQIKTLLLDFIKLEQDAYPNYLLKTRTELEQFADEEAERLNLQNPKEKDKIFLDQLQKLTQSNIESSLPTSGKTGRPRKDKKEATKKEHRKIDFLN